MIKEDVLKSFNGRNVLVTGGTGMIGRQVVDLLCDAQAFVVVVSLDKINVNDNAEHIFGDLTDFEFCLEVTMDMDFVFHLAGVQGTVVTTSTKSASHFVPTLMMNTNVLEACRINKVKKIVYTSSIGAYAEKPILKESDYRIDTHPMSFAGWAKRMAEIQVYAYKRQYGLENFAIVRPANVYGPGDNFDPDIAMVIPALMYHIHHKKNPVLVWGDGTAVRDFVFSKDVAEGIILALYHGTNSSPVNLGSGRGCSIKELVETLNSFIDFDYEFDTTKPSGAPVRIMDISLAEELLGFEPKTSLLDGLRETWQWYLSNQDEHFKKLNYFGRRICVK